MSVIRDTGPWPSRLLRLLEAWLRRYGGRIYPVYSVALFVFALGLLVLRREQAVVAFFWLGGFNVTLITALCIGILLLGFPWSRLGYASFDRITQAGLIWLVGPVPSAVFNGLASLVFPFFIRKQTGQSLGQCVLRAFHNVGMIVVMIFVGGWAFHLAGGSYPVRTLNAEVIIPVAAMILAMQLTNGGLLRIRLALCEGRLRLPLDGFANALETAAALIGLLTAVIAISTDQPLTLSYLFVLLALIYTVKRLSDSRQKLEEKVRERTAHIEAQNQRLEEAQAKQQALVERLDRLSREDDLTGLSNRRHMDEFLRQEKGRVRRYGGRLSIALLDLDYFKAVNDNHSHQAGDQALAAIARILEREARNTDMVSRYGGEEFLVALPNTELVGAGRVVERFRQAIEQHDWSAIADGLKLTVSAGVAQMGDDGDLENLFRRADKRLYEAKDQGRNRVVVAH